MGIEPMHAGATIQCVNHFTKAAIRTSSFLSSQPVSRQVLSASWCLTTVFGMGTGGSTKASPLDSIERLLFQNYTEELLCLEHFSLFS